MVFGLNRRHFIIGSSAVGGLIAMPSLIRAQALPQHFFVGCFYDTAQSERSMAEQFLIAPIRRDAPDPTRTGSELTAFVRDIVLGEKDFCSTMNLSTSGDVGNPIALALTRAQHEVVTIATPGLPTEYITKISVTVSLDIMTDQAAFRNKNQFETIYCTMVVTYQPVQTRNPLSNDDLQKYYKIAFTGAMKEVLARTAKQMKDQRQSSSAVFQVKNMVLPDPLPLELDQLITGGMDALGESSKDARDLEIRKLSREIQHIYTFMIKDQLTLQKMNDIVILPPTSPWTEGHVLSLLKARLGISADILSEPDATKVNGFEIRAGITQQTKSKSGVYRQINVSMGSRIVRKIGDQLTHVPASISDPQKKVAVGAGASDPYPEFYDMKRGVTRDVTMSAIRSAAKTTAVALVPLIKKVAVEI